jgi:hypothetical protein
MRTVASINKAATVELATHLTLVIRKFKVFMLSEDMTYSDKVHVITFVVGSYFKLLHLYKIDEVLYKKAQDELFSAVTTMDTEESVDSTYQLTLYYLELLTKSLRKWL